MTASGRERAVAQLKKLSFERPVLEKAAAQRECEERVKTCPSP